MAKERRDDGRAMSSLSWEQNPLAGRAGFCESMPEQRLRTLTLLDGMALIAATAAGIAIDRAAQPGLRVMYGDLVWRWAASSSPLVSLWMLTILGLRFLPPRPPLRRLARRPGMVACFIVGVYSIWGCASLVVRALGGPLPPHFDYWSYLASSLGHQVGAVVPVAWLTLAFSGRWRPEPSWYDRAGMVLGGYLMVMFWVVPMLAGWLT